MIARTVHVQARDLRAQVVARGHRGGFPRTLGGVARLLAVHVLLAVAEALRVRFDGLRTHELVDVLHVESRQSLELLLHHRDRRDHVAVLVLRPLHLAPGERANGVANGAKAAAGDHDVRDHARTGVDDEVVDVADVDAVALSVLGGPKVHATECAVAVEVRGVLGDAYERRRQVLLGVGRLSLGETGREAESKRK